MNAVINWPTRRWISFSFITFLGTFLIHSEVMACKFKSSEKIVSLAASISGLLNELDLYTDPNLIALSSYHYQADKVESKLVSGGLYLADDTLKSWDKSIVFFDDSSQLKIQLKKFPKLKAISVTTRGQDSYTVYQDSIKFLAPHLIGCENKLAKLEMTINHIRSKLALKLNNYTSQLIFIGVCSEQFWPKTIMVHDGLAKLLYAWFKLELYPSDLSYVSWSEKILNNFLIKKPLILCLDNSKVTNKLNATTSNNYMNLYDSQFLLPGINQILALKQLFSI
jgi:hypothetical protein